MEKKYGWMTSEIINVCGTIVCVLYGKTCLRLCLYHLIFQILRNSCFTLTHHISRPDTMCDRSHTPRPKPETHERERERKGENKLKRNYIETNNNVEVAAEAKTGFIY